MEPYLITPESLNVLDTLIPEEYQKEIVEGSLFGIVMEDRVHDHEIAAVVLLRERNGWMEIVWICLTEPYRGMNVTKEVIEACVKMARENGKAWGVFANLPMGGSLEEVMWEAFAMEGFSFVTVDHHCYTTTLGEVRKQPHFEHLLQEKGAKSVVFLEDTDLLLKKELAIAVNNSSEPVPLPLPVDFSLYDERFSCVHKADEKRVDALLFFTQQKEHLTIECMWSENPNELSVLLGSTIKKLQTLCADDTKIFIPAVTERSAELTKKLLPDAEHMFGVQARLLFQEEVLLWETV